MMSVSDHEQNRLSWNHATTRHHSHKPGLIEQYSLHNRNSLFQEDMELLGDLRGKLVVHLQCNDGQDTVSLTKFLHPRICIGVDISDVACKFAKKLGQEVTQHQQEGGEQPFLTFIRSDIFHFGENIRNDNNFFKMNEEVQNENTRQKREEVGKELKERGADVVYASYGALCWISDLKRYAKSVHNLLAPGGKFVLMEFHPLVSSLHPKTLQLESGMIGGVREEWEGVGDYVVNDYEGNWKNPEKCLEFCYGVADVLSAFLGENMIIESVTEYPYINGWQSFEGMREKEGGGRVYVAPAGIPENIPLMYSIVVRKR